MRPKVGWLQPSKSHRKPLMLTVLEKGRVGSCGQTFCIQFRNQTLILSYLGMELPVSPACLFQPQPVNLLRLQNDAGTSNQLVQHPSTSNEWSRKSYPGSKQFFPAPVPGPGFP